MPVRADAPFGILLTGGSSSRMGRDKAEVPVGGTTLARHLGALLGALGGPALEAGPGRSGLDHVAEDPPGSGPLAAVVAAWEELVRRTGEKRPALVVACDMPALGVELLAWLARYPGPGSVVPVADGHPQVLCARWSVPAMERAAAALAGDGDRSPRRVLDADAVYPGEDEWGEVCPAAALRDVDTPEDLARAALAPPPAGDDWIGLGRTALPSDGATRWVSVPACGAVVTFLGTVRDHAEGRDGVEELAYEAYEAPALARMAEVVAEARRRWPEIGRVAALHRLGRLALGETAVVVAVSTGHRAEAFAAGEFVIDTVKASVPIWKYERWSGGEDWGTGAQPVRPVAADGPGREGR